MHTPRHSIISLQLLVYLGLFLSLCPPAVMAEDPEAVLARLGIELPTPGKSIANYVGATRTGNLVFLSGHIPRREDGSVVTGKLGEDLNVEDPCA